LARDIEGDEKKSGHCTVGFLRGGRGCPGKEHQKIRGGSGWIPRKNRGEKRDSKTMATVGEEGKEKRNEHTGT